MEVSKKTVYKINGVEYQSLDEIPNDYKKITTPELIEKVKKLSQKTIK